MPEQVAWSGYTKWPWLSRHRRHTLTRCRSSHRALAVQHAHVTPTPTDSARGERTYADLGCCARHYSVGSSESVLQRHHGLACGGRDAHVVRGPGWGQPAVLILEFITHYNLDREAALNPALELVAMTTVNGNHDRPSRTASPRSSWCISFARARAEGAAIVLVAVGPLTHVALAIKRGPAFTSNVKRLVIVGGGYAIPNRIASAESDMWRDPEAGRVVGRRQDGLVPGDEALLR